VETTQTNLLWAVRDARDESAWADFYRVYAPMITHFARRLGLSHADADDVTQECLVAASKALREGAYDPSKGRFRAWLYGVARHRALTALRARARPTRAQHDVRESGADLLDRLEDRHGEESLRQLWEQEWRYALLDEALRYAKTQVGAKAFKAFTLLAVERWPAERVAERLRIAPGSVYVYKGRVLEAVRSWVQRFEAD
jgi:RNA polymerase sigma-70 factor (ECF subfamily)